MPAGRHEAALGAGDRALRHGPRAPPRVELPIDAARDAFLRDPPWQPTRRYLERLAATADWGEVVFAANLCFEPTVGTLIRRELGTRAAAASGDTVTPVLARVATQEWEWARAWTIALAQFVVAAARHDNRALIAGWVRDWLPQALEARLALAPLAQRSLGVDAERARRAGPRLCGPDARRGRPARALRAGRWHAHAEPA